MAVSHSKYVSVFETSSFLRVATLKKHSLNVMDFAWDHTDS